MASDLLCQELFSLFPELFSSRSGVPKPLQRFLCLPYPGLLPVTQPLYITKSIPPCQLLFSPVFNVYLQWRLSLNNRQNGYSHLVVLCPVWVRFVRFDGNELPWNSALHTYRSEHVRQFMGAKGHFYWERAPNHFVESHPRKRSVFSTRIHSIYRNIHPGKQARM